MDDRRASRPDPHADDAAGGHRLDSEALTWTGLLAQWVDFARAALALPEDAEGARWRACVPAVINLQAVTFALHDLHRLSPRDHALARDRAEVLIRECADRLATLWSDAPLPDALREVVEDARTALSRSIYACAVELRWEGETSMVMPRVTISARTGTVAVMQPGTIVMPGEPIAWWCGCEETPLAEHPPGCRLHDVEPGAAPRQVYRQLDEAGRIVRDVTAPIDVEPRPGLPLLVPILGDGAPIGRFTLDASSWEAHQRSAMTAPLVPVEPFDPDQVGS